MSRDDINITIVEEGGDGQLARGDERTESDGQEMFN